MSPPFDLLCYILETFSKVSPHSKSRCIAVSLGHEGNPAQSIMFIPTSLLVAVGSCRVEQVPLTKVPKRVELVMLSMG